MKTHIFRLRPGQEIRSEIQKYAKENKIKAGFIITCVAGLDYARLRMAGATPDNQNEREWNEHLEVVSMVGTVEEDDCHLHVAVSDKEGNAFGGHLHEATVFITAEVVIGEDENRVFSREMDDETGFDELVVRSV